LQKYKWVLGPHVHMYLWNKITMISHQIATNPSPLSESTSSAFAPLCVQYNLVQFDFNFQNSYVGRSK